MTLTTANLKALEESEIIEARSITTGQPTTVDIAVQAPGLCQIHAMSGKVYDMARKGDEVRLVEVTK